MLVSDAESPEISSRLECRDREAGQVANPVHILVVSLTLGGAERTVSEVATALGKRGSAGNLFVLWKGAPSYDVAERSCFRVFHSSAAQRKQSLAQIARQVLDSSENVLFTHLIPARDLQVLWQSGVYTVPVIHNSRLGWLDGPDAFDHPMVPFIVAVSTRVARELAEDGCKKPVTVVRHELQRWFSRTELFKDRARTRSRYGVPDDVFLIGMVGNFKAQKAYPTAVRVLHRILQYRPAKLIIVGSWDHSYGYGRTTYEATRHLASELGIEQDLILPGSVTDMDAHYPAFDAFLCTSIYEGLSIAMLEAQQAGCPIVTADAGGNIEGLGPGSQVVNDPSNVDGYVEALLRAGFDRNEPPARPAYPDLIPCLWRQIGLFGTAGSKGGPVLMITNNLNHGGATRSLANLLTRFPRKDRIHLCILGSVFFPECLHELEQAGVNVIRFESPANVVDCAERVLWQFRLLRAGSICFWNVDACVKLLISKVLACGPARIFDVSPGPAFAAELDDAAIFQDRIAFTADDYFSRLDRLVVKSRNATVPFEARLGPGKVAVVANGVDVNGMLQDGNNATFPVHFAEPFRVVACNRIVPEKRVEFLIDAVADVSRRVPEVSLAVVGGPERGDHRYSAELGARASNRGLANIWFPGRQARVGPFLGAGRIFVTASASDGCSNAVLEAMAAGLPVVATETPAVREQVLDGVTGFIVPRDDPNAMGDRIEELLLDQERARAFGGAGRSRVSESFTVDRMVRDYIEILLCEQI